MHLVRCDRCKREVKGYESKQIKIREKRRFLLVLDDYCTNKDLCEECYNELVNWLGER